MRHTHARARAHTHTHTQRQRHRQREKQAPFRELDVGFDPRTLGSRPEPKADAQPLSCPDAPINKSFEKYFTVLDFPFKLRY